MHTEYLKRVVIYLQQELPEYQEMLTVKANQIVLPYILVPYLNSFTKSYSIALTYANL